MVQELMKKLSIRLAPTSRTAFDLFLESANHPTFLRTGLTTIDKALNGANLWFVLRLFADTYQAFIVVTNRASTVESEAGLYTKPLLGDNWAHCVTTRFILERHASNRAITIVKSSVAGYVVQPFTIKEGGVEPIDDPLLSREVNEDDFSIHDELLSDLALGTLPTVDPACTLRSTQQSNPEDPDATQLVEHSDDESQHQEDEQVQEKVTETESSTSFEIVSDSNEEEDESFYWEVTEE
ncbi:hypothetical protein BBO99_00002061 [Phytophthora kernoviae]|uniref:Uncharacterized protein n=2 Tax=Phytophthora kernoviae TaxID=325452 RepID=A0A421GY98_9STRA|nr:hypothetical protein G195_003521 [Phytophthora kernoviae 00238/432]KAG2530374.1 hypothetical protein JM16_001610 [Phytophthora kernoviae]KAG2532578.1 hypothetical protein JM18_000443 [Phytophthora kernoviae]RLN45501.1 hypothetical protein BBI17_001934 [Phytophthora kernoviae]RLN83549.1 hypothetical protein BBO99_00002061 [Phytophthora kernoviae]